MKKYFVWVLGMILAYGGIYPPLFWLGFGRVKIESAWQLVQVLALFGLAVAGAVVGVGMYLWAEEEIKKSRSVK